MTRVKPVKVYKNLLWFIDLINCLKGLMIRININAKAFADRLPKTDHNMLSEKDTNKTSPKTRLATREINALPIARPITYNENDKNA